MPKVHWRISLDFSVQKLNLTVLIFSSSSCPILSLVELPVSRILVTSIPKCNIQLLNGVFWKINYPL